MSAPRKFRVWDGEEMIYPEPSNDYYITFAPDSDHWWELARFAEDHTGDYICATSFDDQSVLMQSTGLTDAEGAEVYEGDVLSYEGRNGVVEYRRDTFWWIYLGEELAGLDTVCSFGGTIIGNKHENPELLEGVSA